MKELTLLLPKISSLFEFDPSENPAGASKSQLEVRCSQLAVYLEYLPCRSGHSATLDGAVDCLVAALRDRVVPAAQRSPAKTIASYNKALTSLNECLGDADRRLSSETLCATQLLGIFEVCTLLFA